MLKRVIASLARVSLHPSYLKLSFFAGKLNQQPYCPLLLWRLRAHKSMREPHLEVSVILHRFPFLFECWFILKLAAQLRTILQSLSRSDNMARSAVIVDAKEGISGFGILLATKGSMLRVAIERYPEFSRWFCRKVLEVCLHNKNAEVTPRPGIIGWTRKLDGVCTSHNTALTSATSKDEQRSALTLGLI